MSANSFILPFDSPDATPGAVGGKGANLSLMTRAYFPAPPGFLITTKAYRAFVQVNDLQKQVLDLANNQTETSEKRSAAVRQLFANGNMPSIL
jgi:rifampicin phosphotransferase